MFDRFTEGARRTLVLAREAARHFQHDYIGTEHILIGLFSETDGPAVEALTAASLSLESVRHNVESQVGRGHKPSGAHISFTPRAKKSLELAASEANSRQHNHIGNEHILLAILRDPGSTACKILATPTGTLDTLRIAIHDLIAPTTMHEPQGKGPSDDASDNRSTAARAADIRATPAADLSLAQAARLAGPHQIGSHHLLLATLEDPTNAAMRALSSLPLDLVQIRTALQNVSTADTSDETSEELGRRKMAMYVTEGEINLVITDTTLVALALNAQAQLGTGAIDGGHPAATSFATVWQALYASLIEIGRRTSASAASEAESTRSDH